MSKSVAVLDQAVDEQKDGLLQLSHALHADPEVGFEEHRSVRRVSEYLAGEGFESTIGVFGLETALEARVGSGGPVIAFLAEYDALPGIGHACGHNVICAAAVGAFVATARHIVELGGTAVLYGTPAEENGTGKELMARAGAFDGVDAALMVHPVAGEDTVTGGFLGLREVEVTYHGTAAHAAASPHLGRNALDAVVTAYQSVAQLRQHIMPTDRIHGIITEGGASPNVIPDLARAHFYVRAGSADRLAELSRQMQQIFEGAATMTGTNVTVLWDRMPACLPVRTNDVMGERFSSHFTRLGRSIQYADTRPDSSTGSTDLGNVSLRIPAIHPMVGIAPESAGMHTAAFTEHVAGEPADKGILDSAKALANVAAELLSDAELMRKVREEFDRAGGALDVEALLAPPA